MFNRIHTVDRAIAPLMKAVADLGHVVTERLAMIANNEATIDQLTADNVVAATELDRAHRISDALEAITDPQPSTTDQIRAGMPDKSTEE